MDMPTENTAADAYLPRSAYTIARVSADTKAAGRQEALELVHENLKMALRERDDLQEQEQKKSALFDAADEACDDDIEGFQLHLLAALKKDNEHAKYKRYFKDGLRAVTQAEPRTEEPDIVGKIVERMAADLSDPDIGDVVQQWRPKLEASRANVLAADEALTAIEQALENLKENKIAALMATWREEYKKIEAALMTVYPTDSKKVARFFKPFRTTRKPSKSQTP